MLGDMTTEEADQGGVVRFTDNTLQPIAADPSNIGQLPASVRTKCLQVFYKGEPLALGVTQLLGGIIQLLLAIAHEVGDLAYPVWSIKLFIGLSPFLCGILVRGSLIANIISAVAAGTEIIVTLIFIFVKLLVWTYMAKPCDRYEEPDNCQLAYNAFAVSWGMLFIIIIFSLLALCLSISIAAFGCKTICRTAFSEVSVVVYQAAPPKTANDDTGAVLPAGENDDTGEILASNEENEKL